MKNMNFFKPYVRKSPIVFLCSPYVDLIEERKAIIYVFEKLKLRHNCMEFFGARTDKPIETSLSEVRQSNIIIVVVGNQYGSLIPDTNISFSEAEYREAYRLELRCLVYLKDESVPVSPNQIERDPQKLPALDKFKEILKQRHTVAYFKNPLELAVSVSIDLLREIQAWYETQPEIPPPPPAPKPSPVPRPIPTPMRGTWNLKMYHEQAVNSPYHLRGHLPWTRDVERATNGRVKVTVYPSQTMIKPMDAWESVKSGAIDIAWIFSEHVSHKLDLSECVTLPFIIPNGDTGSRVAWKLYQKFSEIQAQMADVKILSVCTTEPYLWLTTTKQIKTPEDLKGMKIRATGRSSVDMITLLGGIPIMVLMPETYLALKVGVIDGTLSPTLPVLEFRLYEVCKYYTYMPTVCSYFFLTMNKDVWNEMPPDIQQGIMSVSGETQARRYGAGVFDYSRRELPKIARAAGFGFNEYTVPQEEAPRWFKLAGEPLWKSWVSRMEAEGYKVASQILVDTLNMVKEYSK